MDYPGLTGTLRDSYPEEYLVISGFSVYAKINLKRLSLYQVQYHSRFISLISTVGTYVT
jgi:hypothetical protein